MGAGLTANWRLFDGLGMFSTYARQKTMCSISELQKREQIEQLVAQVSLQYYLIVSLRSRVQVSIESIGLSQLRYREVLQKYSIGAASGLEMNLAKTDLNTDSSQLIKQQESLDLAYIEMNDLLQFTPDQRGYVSDTIKIMRTLDFDIFAHMTLEQNTQILLSQKGVDVSDLDLKLSRAARYPTLDFSAGYNYGFSDANNPRAVLSAQPGFNWGFTLGVNIFGGLETSRKIKNSKIERNIATISADNTVQKVRTSFSSQYTTYRNNLQLIDFEAQNTDAMRLNLDVAMERYRLGELSGIELRIIQQQYLLAVDRKISTIYQAKASEIELITISGSLLK
ncbi:MAG: TolC family protein [Mucinivorans sp.]